MENPEHLVDPYQGAGDESRRQTDFPASHQCKDLVSARVTVNRGIRQWSTGNSDTEASWPRSSRSIAPSRVRASYSGTKASTSSAKSTSPRHSRESAAWISKGT